MPLTSYFRALLLIYATLVFGEMASAPLTVDTLPQPVRNFAESQWSDSGPGEQSPSLMFVALGALLLMISSIPGLWLFWRPARMLYTLYLLFLAIGVVLAGPVIESALTSVLAFMNTIIAGLIMGLLYFSPLREHFDRPVEPGRMTP